jgi:polar amino acid transport system substrate-binding protein
MATNAAFPPYEYYEGNEIVGIDAEIAALIAGKMGMELEIQDMEFGSIIAAVQTGKVDMGMAGMTVNEERLVSVDFSDTYAVGKQVIIVPESSDIASPDDLADKIIGVQESTTGDIYISDEFGDDAVQRYNKGTDAVQALLQDKVDAVVIDNEPAKAFVNANEGLKILETEYALEDYAIAVKKGNTDLLNKINKALAELSESGELQKIIDKYIVAN